MYINADSKAYILMTTSIGIEPGRRAPFTIKKWRSICDKLELLKLSPKCLIDYDKSELRKLYGEMDTDCIIELRSSRDIFAELIALSLKGIHLSTPFEYDYPSKLMQYKQYEAPVVFMYGDKSLLNGANSLAIVGTRDADFTALEFAKKLGQSCAENDVCVVSGGARGIDIAAQRSALENGGGSIFVLPYGLDSPSAKKLMREIAGRYLLLSLVLPSARFAAKTALDRNKQIYQLAKSSVVVSAHDGKGGSWKGAKYAIGSGKVVFARKSDDPAARKLRKLGAFWIEEPDVSQIWTHLPDKIEDSKYINANLEESG